MPEREIRFDLSPASDAEFQKALQFWKDNFGFATVKEVQRATDTGKPQCVIVVEF
jgi:hypothetical protein